MTEGRKGIFEYSVDRGAFNEFPEIYCENYKFQFEKRAESYFSSLLGGGTPYIMECTPQYLWYKRVFYAIKGNLNSYLGCTALSLEPRNEEMLLRFAISSNFSLEDL